MESIMQPESLACRASFCGQRKKSGSTRIPPKSGSILEAVLYRGELPRRDVAGIVGTGDRQARRIVSGLTERGVLVSESPRAPLSASSSRRRLLRAACPDCFLRRWIFRGPSTAESAEEVTRNLSELSRACFINRYGLRMGTSG